MAGSSFFTSAALAAMAAAAAFAVPAEAQDGAGRHGGWRNQTETSADAGQSRAEARAQWQAQRAERAQQAPQQQTEARGRWQQRAEQAAPQQQRSAPDGGWRSQRSVDGGQRAARNWSRGGETRATVQQVPQQAEAQPAQRWGGRNRTYSDPQRSQTYRDGRTGDSWRDRTQQQAYRDGYRSGATADSYRDRRDRTQAYRQGYNSGSRYSGNYDRWSRDSWRRDSRYNWYGYRSSNRDLYRLGRYYSPYRNYSYRRLSIGFGLDSLFYSSRYWINDPWQYRLPEAYGPYRWVRYYDDALLVDIYSGEVVDVIYDFFW